MSLKPIDCHDIYSDPVMYDAFSDHTISHKTDIPFFIDKAVELNGPILELACGTGRVTIPMAKAGFDVTGLDMSAPMLNYARKKAEDAGLKIKFIEADCREFDLKKQFDLIFMPANSIAHIHDRPSHEALFARVREHLSPDGRFVFSWFNPGERYLFRDPEKRYPAMEFELSDGTPVIITESNVYDKATQINYIKWYYKIGDKDEIVQDLNLRMLFPAELDALLHYNGFELEAKYGDFNKSQFESTSIHQVCVCKLRKVFNN
ncbi:MAG: class I SAM-dependent methyltransferase [candidate division Zixibacteria bacterium]|nr:class I SAM-dependent methyltransferase [candidate division Zixibacteria bacterium]